MAGGKVRSCQEFLSADIVFTHVGKNQQAWHQNAQPSCLAMSSAVEPYIAVRPLIQTTCVALG